MTSFRTIEKLTNAYECSTLNNNLFASVVKSLAVSSSKDGANTTFYFADGTTLDCDSLNPFELNWAIIFSADLTYIKDLHKVA